MALPARHVRAISAIIPSCYRHYKRFIGFARASPCALRLIASGSPPGSGRHNGQWPRRAGRPRHRVWPIQTPRDRARVPSRPRTQAKISSKRGFCRDPRAAARRRSTHDLLGRRLVCRDPRAVCWGGGLVCRDPRAAVAPLCLLDRADGPLIGFSGVRCVLGGNHRLLLISPVWVDDPQPRSFAVGLRCRDLEPEASVGRSTLQALSARSHETRTP